MLDYFCAYLAIKILLGCTQKQYLSKAMLLRFTVISTTCNIQKNWKDQATVNTGAIETVVFEKHLKRVGMFEIQALKTYLNMIWYIFYCYFEQSHFMMLFFSHHWFKLNNDDDDVKKSDLHIHLSKYTSKNITGIKDSFTAHSNLKCVEKQNHKNVAQRSSTKWGNKLHFASYNLIGQYFWQNLWAKKRNR